MSEGPTRDGSEGTDRAARAIAREYAALSKESTDA